jgi:hypothetical protein
VAERNRKPWTAEEDAMLGKAADREVAEAIGRTRQAVAVRRRLVLGPARDGHRPWTPEEDAILAALPATEAVEKLGRTREAVATRRCLLGLSRGDGRRCVVCGKSIDGEHYRAVTCAGECWAAHRRSVTREKNARAWLKRKPAQ